jgi:hypothetical protein
MATVHVRVGHAGDQIGRARTQRGQADSGFPGQTPVDVRHESCALLVPRGSEADTAVEQRVHHIDVLFARQAEDVFHAFVLEALHHQFGGFHRLPRCVFFTLGMEV